MVQSFNQLQTQHEQQEAENRLRLFGAERLERDRLDPANPELIETLRNEIADAATDAGGMLWESVYSRRVGPVSDNPTRLIWDPARILYGFVPGNEEHAAATITNISREERWFLKPTYGLLPGKYRITEDLEINNSGTAQVVRSVLPANPYRHSLHATKPASGAEIAAALEVVRSLTHEHIPHLPRYVELAYGLDPSALRGFRSFDRKVHVALDSAEGDYETGYGSYADAIKTESVAFAQRVSAERPGEHIIFGLGEGEHLPFADRTIREVFMANVLNAPIPTKVKRGILKEISRVLETDGRFVTQVNWHQDEWPVEDMKQFLAQNGFSVRRVVDSATHDGYQLLESEYGIQQEVKAPRGYYLICQPIRRRLFI